MHLAYKSVLLIQMFVFNKLPISKWRRLIFRVKGFTPDCQFQVPSPSFLHTDLGCKHDFDLYQVTAFTRFLI